VQHTRITTTHFATARATNIGGYILDAASGSLIPPNAAVLAPTADSNPSAARFSTDSAYPASGGGGHYIVTYKLKKEVASPQAQPVQGADVSAPAALPVAVQNTQAAVQQRLFSRGAAGGAFAGAAVVRHMEALPMSIVALPSRAAAEALLTDPLVESVVENGLNRPELVQSLPLIGQPAAAAQGYNGSGCVVALLDTGVKL
jgi:hypothetical protein